MTRRRAIWLATAWVVSTAAVTVWVTTRTGGEVSVGNGVMVGAVVATLLTVALARVKRK